MSWLINRPKDRQTRDNNFDSLDYLGYRQIMKECGCKEHINITDGVKEDDTLLLSLTSLYDVENLIINNKKPKCRVIVGGSGCININPISDYIDVACFGRCEGLGHDIISGNYHDNMWTGDFNVKLKIRQKQFMIDGENTIGCKNKCLFCQYTWTRKHCGDNNYNPGDSANFLEDDINGIKINKPGRYLTGIDGLSETTRKRVGKNITDNDIIGLLKQVYNINSEKAVNLKLYYIIGYPWETTDSIREDILKLGKLIGECDAKTGKHRMLIMLFFNIFTPDLFTPLEYEPASVDVNYRDIINNMGRQVYKGVDFECFILPQISVPTTVAKRVLLQRCKIDESEKVKKIIRNMEPKIGIMDTIRQYIGRDIFGKIEDSPIPYLSTYINYKHGFNNV